MFASSPLFFLGNEVLSVLEIQRRVHLFVNPVATYLTPQTLPPTADYQPLSTALFRGGESSPPCPPRRDYARRLAL